MGKKLLAGDVDAVRTAAAHIAVLDVQPAGSGVGLQSYGLYLCRRTWTGQCNTQRGRIYVEKSWQGAAALQWP